MLHMSRDVELLLRLLARRLLLRKCCLTMIRLLKNALLISSGRSIDALLMSELILHGCHARLRSSSACIRLLQVLIACRCNGIQLCLLLRGGELQRHDRRILDARANDGFDERGSERGSIADTGCIRL
jgi:hypothetical protein